MLARQVFTAVAAFPTGGAGLIVAVPLDPLTVAAFGLVVEDEPVLCTVQRRVGVERRNESHTGSAPISRRAACGHRALGTRRVLASLSRGSDGSVLSTNQGASAGLGRMGTRFLRAPIAGGAPGGHPGRQTFATPLRVRVGG